GLAVRGPRFHHLVDLAFRVQARLEVVNVEADAEGLQVDVLFGAQRRDGELPYRFQIRRVFLGGNIVARDLLDVLPGVPLLGPARRAGTEAASARLHRQGQLLDLRAAVVVVELAGDGIPLRLEQRRDRVAERRLTPVSDVQRSRRICRNELHLHLLAAPLARAAEPRTLLEDAA